jgi:hypothetical protein
VLVHELADARLRTEETTQGALVVDVLLIARVDDQPVRLPGQEIGDELGEAGLTGGFVEPLAGTRVDAHLDREPGEGSAAEWLLILEVEVALAGCQFDQLVGQ